MENGQEKIRVYSNITICSYTLQDAYRFCLPPDSIFYTSIFNGVIILSIESLHKPPGI